jgi:FdhD protein
MMGRLSSVDALNPAVQTGEVVRIEGGRVARRRDAAAREEPLEIRFGGSPFVVIMRTPGADRELAAGFLLSERIITHLGDIASIQHCTDTETRDPLDAAARTFTVREGNVLNVWLTGDAAARAAGALAHRRSVTANSSCGVCGRRSIDDLLCNVQPTESTWTLSPDVIAGMPLTLRGTQAAFDETGGLHAAGLFDRDGVLVASAEDVGRHNAVDKVIGQELFLGRIPLSDRVLFVSGRTSFEIVQKAVVAGIPVIAAVSAPSSLAIELARDANVTLVGFVRGDACNIYSGAHRIQVW